MAEGGKVAVGADDAVVSAQEHRELKRHINGLLLARHTGRGNHDGKVTTLRSNLRWCSDTFEIPAR